MYKQRLLWTPFLNPVLFSPSVQDGRECNLIQLYEMTPEHKGLQLEGDGCSLSCLESRTEQRKAAVELTPDSLEMGELPVVSPWWRGRLNLDDIQGFPLLLQKSDQQGDGLPKCYKVSSCVKTMWPLLRPSIGAGSCKVKQMQNKLNFL